MTDVDNPFAEPKTIWVRTINTSQRRRGLATDDGNPIAGTALVYTREWRELTVLDVEPDEIARRIAGGESVVSAIGFEILRADRHSFEVRDTPPPPPQSDTAPPVPPALPRAPTPMREIARDFGVRIPAASLTGARSILRSTFLRLSEMAADSREGRVLRRFGDHAIAGVVADEARRLRYALADKFPFAVAGGGVFGSDPTRTPLPPTLHRWSGNESVSRAWLMLAEQFGATFPPPFSDPFAHEREQLVGELGEAQNPTPNAFDNVDGSFRDPFSGRLVHVAPMKPVAPDEDPNEAAKKRLADAERALAEVNARSVRAQTEWSEACEAVRRRVAFAIDAALAGDGLDSMTRFALHELARDVRGLPITTAFTAVQLADMVIGRILFEAPDVVEREDAGARTMLRVWTKPHIPASGRNRAGFRFTREPIVVAVDDAQFAEIERDDGLEFVDAKAFVSGTRMPSTRETELLAEIAALEREREDLMKQSELKRQLAQRPPTRSSNPARVTRPRNEGDAT